MENPLMVALKDAVVRGNKHTLVQSSDARIVTFTVSGGMSDIAIRVPFLFSTTLKDALPFKWEATGYARKVLVSAIEAMPNFAAPTFIVDVTEWDGGGLLLSGDWEKKKAGRSKETAVSNCIFLIDAGILKPV